MRIWSANYVICVKQRREMMQVFQPKTQKSAPCTRQASKIQAVSFGRAELPDRRGRRRPQQEERARGLVPSVSSSRASMQSQNIPEWRYFLNIRDRRLVVRVHSSNLYRRSLNLVAGQACRILNNSRCDMPRVPTRFTRNGFSYLNRIEG